MSLSRSFLFSLLCLPVLVPLARGAEPTLTLAGLRVVQEATTPGGPTAFNWRPGTGVVLRLAAALPIAVVDVADSRLDGFVDGSGKDLGSGAVLRVGDLAGGEALIDISSAQTPSPQATDLRLSGRVTCLCGGTASSASSLPVAPAVGVELQAGAMAYRIERFEPSEWEEGHHDLALAANGSELLVGAVELLDAQGAPVAVDTFVEGTGEARRHVFLLADPPPATVTLRLTLHRDVERLVVPFDLRIGLGGRSP